MKSIIKISTIMLAGLLFFASCNKDKYKVGAATVSGTVTYKNGGTGTTDAAPFADVHIAYNTTVAKLPYDMTIKADSAGKFTVKLPTGSYYFSADFADGHGFNYTTVQGTGVSINNTSDQVTTVAIIVQ
jgi:hypothetical protein